MIRAVAVGYAYALPEPDSWDCFCKRYHRDITNIKIALLEGEITRDTKQKLTKRGRKVQDTLTQLILRKVGLQNVTYFDIKTHIPILEKVLNVQILILDQQFKNKFIYKGEHNPIKIFLHLRKNHYDVINSLTSFFCNDYYCTSCLKPYKNRQTHLCDTHCIVCKRDNCVITSDCVSCRYCQSIECFEHHKKPFKYKEGKIDKQSPASCDSYWKCTRCMHTLNVSDREPLRHRCTEYKCQMCDRFVMPGHRCY